MSNAPQQDNARLGIIFVISAMFMFASQDAITKILASDYSAAQIIWVRFAIFVPFALFISARKRPIRACLRSRAPVLQIARSLLIVAEIAVFIFAVRHLTLAEIHALIATFPLMATGIAALFLREPVGIRRWAAVFVGFAGVLIIVRPGLIDIQPGMFLALLTALMFATYHVMTRLVSRYDDGETSTVYAAITGIVVMTAIGPFYWTTPTLAAWGWMICLALISSAGHFLLIKALEAAPASTLQPFNYTLLVFATVIGFVVFGNLPDFWTVTGASVIVASGLYTIYRERIRKQAG